MNWLKPKEILKNGLKLKIKFNWFGEKKQKTVHPSQQERTDWTEDIIRRRQR